MPELPEVQTTVNGLNEHVIGLKIADVWSSYNSPYFKGSNTIKDPLYFKVFKKEILGRKIVSVIRRAKNILIKLDNDDTILVHMKMTGHLLFGQYHFNQKNKVNPWEPIEPEGLKDPFNRHVRFVLTFSNKKHLALSDTRKFAKVTLIKAEHFHKTEHLHDIGPEPLEEIFDLKEFNARIDRKPNAKIKQVLLDQSNIAGIGNIYADESLWLASIHPAEKVRDLSNKQRADLFKAVKSSLSKGINLGGASTSDYRNINGEKGTFQQVHHAYQRADTACDKRGCKGIIQRIVIGARGTHYCPEHQKLNK